MEYLYNDHSALQFGLFILSYFIGAIPFGLVLTKLAGRDDIRKSGSGNIGATNVLRTSGKFLGLLTLLLDGAKGAAMVLLSSKLSNSYDAQILIGLAAILGHIFSPWLKFKGGKGVATALGVYLALSWQFGLILCLIWLLSLAIFRISAVSALTAFILSPFIIYFWMYNLHLLFLVSAVCVIIVIRHKDNIQKLLKKKSA